MERREIVTNLVEWRGHLPDLVAAAHEFPYDSEVPLITLTADHIRKALERYLRGDATADQLEAWALAIEGRDDIEYFEPHENQISDALFRLSTPEINDALSKEVVEGYLAKLSAL
jgi:hypothetical protein